MQRKQLPDGERKEEKDKQVFIEALQVRKNDNEKDGR